LKHEIRLVLTNTKGKEFEVTGSYSAPGKIKAKNPRPERYPFKLLYTDPNVAHEEDPKRLFWVENGGLGELSPFRIQSLLLVKKPSKNTRAKK